MTDIITKIKEQIINEATAHDTTKDIFRANFNLIYNDMYNKGENFEYFTRANCVFHHINGAHNCDNIANVLLIRDNNDSKDAATTVHMLIHMYALLLNMYNSYSKNTEVTDVLKLFKFNLRSVSKSIELWTFEAPSYFTGNEDDLKSLENQAAMKRDEFINWIENNPSEDIKKYLNIQKRTGKRDGETYISLYKYNPLNTIKDKEGNNKLDKNDKPKVSKAKSNKLNSYKNEKNESPFNLKQWDISEYLRAYSDLLSKAESTTNFLNGVKTESFKTKPFTRQLKEAINGLTKTLNEKDSNCNGYGNQLMDLSYALENKDKCLEEIKWGNFGILDAGTPLKTGCYYVLPDGRAITAKNHADIDRFLIRQGFIKPKEGHTRKEIYDNFDYGDGSQFLEAIGCIRLRRRGGADSWMLPYLTLSNSRPTTIQYEKMIQWLDFVLEASGVVQVVAPANVDGVINDSHIYKKSLGDTTDDIIDGIKFFYRTKSLPEDLIDYTDNEKQLEEAAQTWRCFEQF